MNGPARQERGRRVVHLASGLLGVGALRLPPTASRWLFLGLAASAIILEVARRISPAVSRGVDRVAGPLFRPAEERAVSAATLLAGGYALTWLLFPGPVAARAITLTAVCDPAAAWLGSRWSGTRGRKSVIGTLAAFSSALLVLALWRTPPLTAAWVAAAAALAERIPGRGADNVAIPLAAAVTFAVLA